jgi:hypothetical protein
MDSKINLYHLGTDGFPSSVLLIGNTDYNLNTIVYCPQVKDFK